MDEAPPTSHAEPATPRTPAEILVEWANTQDGWARRIVAEVLATGKAIGEDSAASAYESFLVEKGLKSGSVVAVPNLEAGVGHVTNTGPLRLLKLKHLGGVNALEGGQEIVFNDHLTVVYGENGTGKTGYVRILKQMAAVRSAETILGNVHELQAAASPKAVVDFSLNGVADATNWTGESGVFPFTMLSVFDSPAVAIHLDEDLTYTYTPSDLELFRLAHDAVEKVRSRLERQKAEKQLKGNPYMPRFQRGTSVFPKIETLGASTQIGDLEALASVPEEVEQGLAGLRERVAALRPQASEARIQLAKGDLQLLTVAESLAKKALAFDFAGYNAAIERVDDGRRKHEEVTRLAFEGETVPGTSREPWRTFILAGEAYLRDIGQGPKYPQPTGDQCIYCRQELAVGAQGLIRKYREFATTATKRALDDAQADLSARLGHLRALDGQTVGGSIGRRLAQAGQAVAVSPVMAAVLAVVERLRVCQDDVRESRPVDPGPVLEAVGKALPLLDQALAETTELLRTLQGQADERQKAHQAATSELQELEARLSLRAMLPALKEDVEKAQWANKATILLSNLLPKTQRSLTEASKRASETLLNHDFEERFRAECAALRAPDVTLNFPGRRGEPARRKTVAEHRLSTVMSEGEQKVLAFADFLAETYLRGSSIPIVLDDPVSSLDHRRLQEVATRIAALSEEQQVIVFTHDIWLTVRLLELFDESSQKAKCSYFQVSEAGGLTGVVTRGSHPRWDTIKLTTGKINTIISEASKATGEAQGALVESGYNWIRNWCEIFVEQEVLQGVSQRYQSNIMMTRLAQIKGDRLSVVVGVVDTLFLKACRVTPAHSQPLTTLSVRPTLRELQEDWKNLQAARDSYNNA